LSSRALTRDGIPLAADLSVTFMLDPGHGGRPREGTHPSLSPYEFHPDSAARAVYGHAYDRAQDVPWTELAVRLVADAWREQVRTRALDEFVGEGPAAASTLEDIRRAIAQQLAPSRESRTLTPTGSGSGREAEILKSRGIRLLDVRVANLRFPAEVQAERIRQWQLRWEADREPGLSQARELEQAASRQGTRDAEWALAEGLTAGLRQALARGDTPELAAAAALAAADSVRIAEGQEALEGLDTLAPHLRAIVRELKGEPSAGEAQT
jgi:regulator of protease activity HflC (stomatin/prohibitin superfamily)